MRSLIHVEPNGKVISLSTMAIILNKQVAQPTLEKSLRSGFSCEVIALDIIFQTGVTSVRWRSKWLTGTGQMVTVTGLINGRLYC